MTRTRVLIAGAAGRDFHNFNLVYRGRDDVEVVAFTATQIPNIDGRVYPPQLAGALYPDGIPILPESDARAHRARARDRRGRLRVLRRHARARDAHRLARARGRRRRTACSRRATRCSPRRSRRRDLRRPHRLGEEPDDAARRASSCATRASASPSCATRCRTATSTRQAVQRFERYEDLEAADATIEEREEYEPHLAEGNLVFAGIDYAAHPPARRSRRPT